MCGIAGIVNLGEGPAPAAAALRHMLGALHHRGPDERGIYRDHHAGLAHTRLSIIDLATGQQPLSTDDGAAWIAFNGEIFNYVELRDELSALGHGFRTRSDTEVLLRAWQQWGEAAFARLNGQWAAAIWEPRARRLVLSRDRFGIRPLHYADSYAETDGRVVFASEVKAVFAGAPSLERTFDPIGLDQCFTFWAPVAPRTIFRHVRELEPGHTRIYHAGTVVDRAYFAPRYEADFAGTVEDAADCVRQTLERATALRMLRADVDVGCYLSGGLDSSLIAALGLRAKGAGFHTFSLRFEDAEYDETRYQRLMAERLGTEHHEVVVSRSDIARALPSVVRHAERPLLRSAPAPLLLLSRLVRETGMKVVLTGEGADEMFAGYDIFREGVIRRFWGRDPDSRLRPRLLEKLYPYLARSPVAQQAMARKFFGRELHRWDEPGFAHGTRWSTTAALKRLVHPDLRPPAGTNVIETLLASLPDEASTWSHLARDQYLEVRTLMSGYLLSSQGDRMLMGSSVEGRFPFLDHNVAALANSLPDRYKLRVLDEKHVLKRAAAALVPEAIVRRPKQPYRAPDALAFVGADRPAYIDEVLSERAVTEAGVLQPRAVTALWNKCRARADSGQFSNTDNMALMGALSIQLLHRELISATYDAAPGAVETLVDKVANPEPTPRTTPP